MLFIVILSLLNLSFHYAQEDPCAALESKEDCLKGTEETSTMAERMMQMIQNGGNWNNFGMEMKRHICCFTTIEEDPVCASVANAWDYAGTKPAVQKCTDGLYYKGRNYLPIQNQGCSKMDRFMDMWCKRTWGCNAKPRCKQRNTQNPPNQNPAWGQNPAAPGNSNLGQNPPNQNLAWGQNSGSSGNSNSGQNPAWTGLNFGNKGIANNPGAQQPNPPPAGTNPFLQNQGQVNKNQGNGFGNPNPNFKPNGFNNQPNPAKNNLGGFFGKQSTPASN